MGCTFTYLGTQLGEDRSTSQVAYRFMWTGRLEVMLTGLEGCMCGEGTPPVRGSPPRSDILEAANKRLSGGDRSAGSKPGALPASCFFYFVSLELPLLLLVVTKCVKSPAESCSATRRLVETTLRRIAGPPLPYSPPFLLLSSSSSFPDITRR